MEETKKAEELKIGPRKGRKSVITRISEAVCVFLLRTARGVRVRDKPDFEDLEIPQKYIPRDFNSICQTTGFSPASLRRLYRGFKNECPTGLMTEEAFRQVFSKFFPSGATCSAYSHYVFSSLDQERRGVLTFEDFALSLALLRRGTLEQKLVWTFHLYDLNGDGLLSREEIRDVTTSIYSLVGDKETGSPPSREVINTRVEMVAKKFGLTGEANCRGISLPDFLTVCLSDEEIYQALLVMGVDVDADT